MKYSILYFLCFFLFAVTQAQQGVERIIIVTTDGLRWQEVFGGMDSSIAVQSTFNQGDSSAVFQKFWDKEAAVRRRRLMPFFWSTIAEKGQVWGNRLYNNKVNTANKYWFSYPGYNEIFTGFPDTAVNSNSHPANEHVSVLEYLHRQPKYKGRVAAFTAWNAFDRILNEQRSGFPVVAAFDTLATNNLSPQQVLLHRMLADSYKPWHNDECLDVFTHHAAFEYLKTAKPKVLYIAYGETDEWAHAGQYRDYLNAAHQVDKWLGELWQYVQTDAAYKDRTALLISVDHGRGTGEAWTSHGSDIAGADEIWFAVLAPGLPAKGEVKTGMQLHQQQLAQTIANLLNEVYEPRHKAAESLMPVLKK